jgi:hypothetical protein
MGSIIDHIGTDLRALSPERLVQVLRPLPEAVWQADYPLSHLDDGLGRLAKDYGPVNMEPDFQRGHVWTAEQQQKFCEAFVRKFIPSHLLTFQFNCPHWNNDAPTDLPREIQCIDGLQRLTALRKLMAGEIKPFGVSVETFNGTSLQITRIHRHVKIQMHAFKAKADLLQYYLDLNEGATPHTPAEIARVKAMLAGWEQGDADTHSD